MIDNFVVRTEEEYEWRIAQGVEYGLSIRHSFNEEWPSAADPGGMFRVRCGCGKLFADEVAWANHRSLARSEALKPWPSSLAGSGSVMLPTTPVKEVNSTNGKPD